MKMWLKTRISVAVLGVVLCIFSLILWFFVVPLFVKDQIEQTVRLDEGLDSYARWKDLPIPIKYKIYFFNISNPEEVRQGQKPKVQEIGPYIYNQERWKTNITKDEDTLFYFQNLQYTFDDNASFPLTDTDEIHVANLPLMAIITIAEKHFFSLLPAFDMMIDRIFGTSSNLFLRTTPRDFLFDGVFLACDSHDVWIIATCKIIEKLAPPTLIRLEDGRFKFSLLSHKNNTDDEGDFVINSGTKTIDQLGQISSWKGSPTLSTWSPNSTCNNIIGSDATIFPPFQTPESVINVFSVDICRSVTLEYSSDITYSGISGHRFVAGKNMLASSTTRPSNECYCLNKTKGIRGNDTCLLDGALELWSCQKAPVVMSLPHFYLGDKVYKDGIDGLNPDGSLHEMHVDLEPNTGTPLRGHKRAQFNIFYRQIPNITLTKNLETVLMPIVWLDEGVDLPDDLVNELNEQLFNVLDTINILFWTVLTIGLIIIVFIVGWSVVICYKKRNDTV